MKLCDLISLSTLYNHEHGLKDVLGDDLLVTENTIYRNIRQYLKKNGTEFVPAWSEYQISPLMQLDRILKSKKIPYSATLKVMKDIELVRPGKFEINDLPSLPHSYHFHESCHLIADELVNPNIEFGDKTFIIKSLLCESFANATESIATLFSNTPRSSTCLMFNCYLKTSDIYKTNAHALIQNIGLLPVFKIVLFSYMYANFLYKKMNFSEFKRILPKIAFREKIPKHFHQKCFRIFCEGFLLSRKFRLMTNSFFLRLGGIEQEYFKALEFNFLLKIERSPELLNAIEEMGRIVEFGALPDARAQSKDKNMQIYLKSS